ncbi:MAG TPA: 50S ribosomal protein L1 [archaeon]|nr:50S ribosomal protein L1 [archaeon]
MAEQETSAAQKKAEAAAPEKVVKAGKDWVARVKEAKQAGAGRKFEQTWDFVINLKGLDLKRPENRFSSEVVLPEGRGKELKVAVISDALTAEAKQSGADLVIEKVQLEQLAKDRKQAKRIANEYDWFLGEVALMAQIGKTLGMVMGPRGKIPKPVPPKASVKAFVERAKRTVRVVVRDMPVVHVSVGAEKMDEAAVVKNM